MSSVTLPVNDSIQGASQILSDAQVTFFKEQGYLSVDRVTTDEDVAEIRGVLEELFEKKAGHSQGAYFNFAGDEKDKNAPNLPQIMAPVNFAGRLKKSQFRENAMRIAQQILGPEVFFHIDHTLMKPPVNGVPTPWHQDEAFKDPRFECREISIWMPLQAVNDVNGCMEFIPRTHLGPVLPHRTPGNDPSVHAIECYDGFNLADKVSCPIPAGGCTIHDGRTLHGAGPHRSNLPRYAYVLIFQLPATPVKTPRSFPWMENKATERMQRQQQWLNKGGRFVRLWRRVRDKSLSDYKRTLMRMGKKVSSRFSSRVDGDGSH
jgi:ectoine hydroxylase-related dioxygenase (phytanoyl-CoA dioxygenase family)